MGQAQEVIFLCQHKHLSVVFHTGQTVNINKNSYLVNTSKVSSRIVDLKCPMHEANLDCRTVAWQRRDIANPCLCVAIGELQLSI